DSGVLRKCLEPLLEQLGIHFPEFGLGYVDVPDEIGTVCDVDRNARQGFVHRDERCTEARDACEIAKCLLHGLADDDSGIFGRVVEVDVQVTLRTNLQIDHRVPRETFEHMVEKADSGVDVGITRAVEVERHGDFGLAGLAFNSGCAHGQSSDSLWSRYYPK